MALKSPGASSDRRRRPAEPGPSWSDNNSAMDQARHVADEPEQSDALENRFVASEHFRLADGQTLISLSCLIIGAAAIGSVMIGFLKGSEITPVLVTAGGGLCAVSLWWMTSKRYLEAWVFGAIGGFDVTYALLQLGITNRWYGIPIEDLANVVSIYLATWAFILLLLLFATAGESPRITSLLLAIEISISLVIAANLTGSVALLRWAALMMAVAIALSSYYMIEIFQGWRRRRQVQESKNAAAEQLVIVREISHPLIEGHEGAYETQ